jgi:hypothetical protein
MGPLMLRPVSSGLARNGPKATKDSTEANQAADMASCEVATLGTKEIGVVMIP